MGGIENMAILMKAVEAKQHNNLKDLHGKNSGKGVVWPRILCTFAV